MSYAHAFILLTLSALLGAGSVSAPSQSGVTVTFLANEGVMISSGSHKVLIDALFEKYETGYALPADSTRAAMQRAVSPFDSVDLILITHRHGDHFHPAPVVNHLLANREATLVTSAQVIDSLRGRLPSGHRLGPRILSRTLAPGVRQRERVNGILLELLGLPHGGRRHRSVEHLGYVVELGGRRVLHVGDTDISDASFAPFRLDTARIDVALLPQWMVTSDEGRRTIERWIKPKQVVAIHVGEGEGDKAAREVRAVMPTAFTFSRSLESRRW